MKLDHCQQIFDALLILAKLKILEQNVRIKVYCIMIKFCIYSIAIVDRLKIIVQLFASFSNLVGEVQIWFV